MNYAELIALLKRVLVSWEVLGVTAALVLYLSLVFYVGQLNRRPRPPAALRKAKAAKPAKAKAAKAEGEAAEETE
ncbi:MAG: hypothetical protein A2Z99_09120 [Treponema sp. GWB1_62_6]|nr:MAG: hypothetical protein A2Y36_13920 [Treponema sp. GWA1_62_8]OHE63503.1 MAG: hypothetical protein A2Z99_09120 [Treponema sp. GWB1_62_6]OHE68515.1 MAG: hypothetical protein A2413_04850 [Treponema sp. RIFOXYC1_FULL_61_9]OHE70177.1 MAG: hypothetical protein A2001_06840 [Treponema sp. GWC1_61_84]HCM28442.1 hypothetical protein [Treponema sp.]